MMVFDVAAGWRGRRSGHSASLLLKRGKRELPLSVTVVIGYVIGCLCVSKDLLGL